MDLKAITALVALAGAFLTLVTNTFGILDKIVSGFRWLLHKVRPTTPNGLPTRTIVTIVDPRMNSLYWGHTAMGAVPAMQVVGDFQVTNISTGSVRLLVSALRYRHGLSRKIVQTTPMVKDLASQYSGQYPIPAGETTKVRVNFIYPDRQRPESPGDWFADVALVDQFNNYHWLKGLRFKHPSKMIE